MKTRGLCKAFLEGACENNVEFYRDMLEKESVDAVKDQTWKEIIALARSLDPAQREVLLKFSRQSAVDAISTVFGAIDGNVDLGGKYFSLKLKDGDGVEHAGSLQDSFVELAYRHKV